MNRLKVFILASIAGCLNLYAESTPLTFKPGGYIPTVGTGAHKSPLRLEMPSATYDSDSSCLKFEYSECLNGTTYRVKNSDGSIVLPGILTFNDSNYAEVTTDSLCCGEYSVEIVMGGYVAVAEFVVK